jgi:hypothetical protein
MTAAALLRSVGAQLFAGRLSEVCRQKTPLPMSVLIPPLEERQLLSRLAFFIFAI